MRKNMGLVGQLKKHVFLSIIFLGIAFLLLFFADRSQRFAEWYAAHIYSFFTATIGTVLGVIPFSVAEISLYVLVLALIGHFIWVIISIIRRKHGAARLALFASRLVLTASLLLCFYVMWCGVNYRRISFAGHAGIIEADYTVEELKELCWILTEDINALSKELPRDGGGAIRLGGAEQRQAAEAMANLGQEYTVLAGYYPQPKKMIAPQFLAVQKLSGIYSPFTIEANYNNDMTAYNIPFTACHELAHLKGFMEEEEANFIAYLACIRSDSELFQYSGAMTAWIYSTNALHKVDREAYREISEHLAAEVKYDIQENRMYWQQYEGKIAEVSNKMNNSYLKVNGQKDGVISYGRMVDLIIAYGKPQA